MHFQLAVSVLGGVTITLTPISDFTLLPQLLFKFLGPAARHRPFNLQLLPEDPEGFIMIVPFIMLVAKLNDRMLRCFKLLLYGFRARSDLSEESLEQPIHGGRQQCSTIPSPRGRGVSLLAPHTQEVADVRRTRAAMRFGGKR